LVGLGALASTRELTSANQLTATGGDTIHSPDYATAGNAAASGKTGRSVTLEPI
jgi:hypothetical protein